MSFVPLWRTLRHSTARARWRDLGALLLLALASRLGAAALISQPGYTDAFYYYNIAYNLATGQGLVENFVWNYLRPIETLPQPSNGYWPPLVSLTIAPWLVIFGDSFRAAQAPSLLSGSLAALVGYQVGHQIGGSRRAAWWTGLLTLFSGVAFPMVSTTDSFGLYSLIGSASLLVLSLALTTDPRYYLPAGLLAGLASLARADGLLLAGLILLTALAGTGLAGTGLAGRARICFPSQAPRAHRFSNPLEARSLGAGLPPRGRGRRISPRAGDVWTSALGGLTAWALVIAPWAVRNLIVFGAPLAGAGLQTVFLRDYNEIFGYPPDLTLSTYLAWGVGPILASKLHATAINLLLLASLLHLYLAPFALIGFWRVRQSVAWWPALAYLGVLLVILSWVFTLPGQRGAFFHSAVALQPFLALAALIGLDSAIEWVGARRPRWSVRRAKQNYARIALLFAALGSLGLAVRESQTWDREYAAYRWAADWIRSHGDPTAAVMAADAPAYHYITRGPVIAAVNEDLDVTAQVALRFGVRYLLLEEAHPIPWHAFYLGQEQHPALRLLATNNGTKIYEFD